MGGHAEVLLMTSPASVRLLGLDVDPEAVRRAGARLARFGDRVRLARESFGNLRSAAEAHGVGRAHAILLDLGVSSDQLETSGRGFSFQRDEPLDMRLDPSRSETAAELVNRRTEVELARILVEYGEERHARRIARAIVRRRPLRTTGDLVAAVRSAVPRAAWPRRLHVATRTFQAVRMAVNDQPAALRADPRRGPRRRGAARRRRAHRRRDAGATGPTRIPARRGARAAGARAGERPTARDRGGDPSLARAGGGARPAARAARAGARSDAAGARVRRRRDQPGGHAVGPHRGSSEVTHGDLRARVLILAAVLAVAFAGLTGRLAWLQVVKRAELAQLAERQYSRTVVLHAQRGPILDRQGTPLATSTPTESLFVQPRSVGDPVRVTARLAPIIGLPPADVHAVLTSSRSFVWLRRRLPPAVAAGVRALREPGLGFLPEPLRLYPNRELAAHVVGFEGVEGGLEGIERAFDGELAGTPGKAIVGRDALGREVAAPHMLEPPQPGLGVMLTLDRAIQYMTERELDAAYRRTGARSAMAVVLDPRTGEVLALAIRPTFNPNTFLDVPSRDRWRDRAVTDPFEPRSTFQVILAAAALEEGVGFCALRGAGRSCRCPRCPSARRSR